MAYTAKCDTAAATKWWITGTGSVVNRLSEAMDDNGAGVEEDDNPGNFQPWTTFMTEHVEDGLYQIHLDFEIGDGSTATTLATLNEFVWCDDGVQPAVTNNATFNMGTTGGGSAPIRGSAWRWQNESQGFNFINATGVFTCYASMLMIKPEANAEGPELVGDCNATFERVIINQHESLQRLDFWNSSDNASFKNVYFTEGRQTCLLKATPATFENVTVGDGAQAPYGVQGNVVMVNPNWYDSGTYGIIDNYLAVGGYQVTVRNPAKGLGGSVQCRSNDDAQIYEQYPCNINVADKDGSALSGVSVLIEDTNPYTVSRVDSGANLDELVAVAEQNIDVTDGTKFSAGQHILIEQEVMLIDSISTNTLTVTRAQNGTSDVQHIFVSDIYILQTVTTDGSGDIEEQMLNYQQWYGTSETEVDYSPHKFTLSKAGYETLILEAITVDGPIDWHLELQDPSVSKKIILLVED